MISQVGVHWYLQSRLHMCTGLPENSDLHLHATLGTTTRLSWRPPAERQPNGRPVAAAPHCRAAPPGATRLPTEDSVVLMPLDCQLEEPLQRLDRQLILHRDVRCLKDSAFLAVCPCQRHQLSVQRTAEMVPVPGHSARGAQSLLVRAAQT